MVDPEVIEGISCCQDATCLTPIEIRFYTNRVTFLGLIIISRLMFAKFKFSSISLISGHMGGPEVIEGVILRQNITSMTPLKIENYCYIHHLLPNLATREVILVK